MNPCPYAHVASAKPVRKEGRLAKVQVAKSPDVGEAVKQNVVVARKDARKVLPRIPVVISGKIKSKHIKKSA